MLIPVHAGIGWMLAEAGQGSRRFRQMVLAASVLPDLDGLFTFYSQTLYETYHDRITHSLLFSLLVSCIACFLCRKEKIKVLVFTQIAFYLHYFGDYFLSGWQLAYWFPFSRTTYVSGHSLWLGHPVNYVLWLVSLVIIVIMAWRLKRSPFEALSAKLDERICNFLFRKKNDTCRFCNRPTNEKCVKCGAPVCIRHGPLNTAFEPNCIECHRKPLPPQR